VAKGHRESDYAKAAAWLRTITGSL
jgi:hypothetical protein